MSSHSIGTKGKSTGRLHVLPLRHREALSSLHVMFPLFLLSLGSDHVQSFLMTPHLCEDITKRKKSYWIFFRQIFSQREVGSLILTHTGSVSAWLNVLEYFPHCYGNACRDSCGYKRLLCAVKMEINRVKYWHFTSNQLTVSILRFNPHQSSDWL